MGIVLDLVTMLIFAAVWFGIAKYLRSRRKKSLTYLTFFTIFAIYIYKVLDYTLLQFQSLLLVKALRPSLRLRGYTVEESVNFVPLFTLASGDVKTSLLNVLLFVPFGFGLPFIASWSMSSVVVAGFLFSTTIELLQLLTGMVSGVTFRIADVNDIIFNTLGAAIGYLLFVGFVSIYRLLTRNGQLTANPLLRHIAERPQLDGRLR